MKALIRSCIKTLVPRALVVWVRNQAIQRVFTRLEKEYPAYRVRLHARVERLRQKEVINVVFFLWHPSYWKVDSLFRLMMDHPRFNPVVCPVQSSAFADSAKKRLQTLQETRDHFKKKGYPVLEVDGLTPIVKSYILSGNNLKIIRKAFAPDIIFVSAPYETVQESMDADMEHELYCYVPYAYRNSRAHFSYNNATQNKYWFNFVENRPMMEFIQSIMTNKGDNLCLSGYPPVDFFLFHEQFGKNTSVWKEQGHPCKRVIWAPHWAMGDTSVLKGGIFPLVADRMLEFARQNNGRIQFAFKPHPRLKAELYNHPDWGIERTDAYYKAWADLPNGQLEQGEYAELFAQSDAMVHDSGSFIVEYMATGKPCCFLHGKEAEVLPDFNQMTADCHAAHYLADSIDELEHFLQDVVMGGNDSKAGERDACRQKYIIPPNSKSAAQNIIDALLG